MRAPRFAVVLCALTLAPSHAPPAFGGDVEGTVILPPKEASRPRAARSRYPGDKPAAAGEFLRGPAVVFLEGVTVGAPFRPPEAKPEMAQKDRQFVPLALPILVGTVVRFPNGDDEYHNVFSRSQPKELELGRYGQGEFKEITFDKPGLVRLHCEIHGHMHAVILVLDNPYFTVADDKGRYAIRNVPAGKYRLCAFHEELEPEKKTASGIPVADREVEVSAEGKVTADFALSKAK